MTDIAASDVATFESVRGRIFGITYRMLGSVRDAEDVVQETWLRWQRTDRRAVRDPLPFLVTTATRIALNVAQSATKRREFYLGPWIPEPVDTSADPSLGAENDAVLDLAVMLLLERLSPVQRACYVLREAFGYPYRDIAEVLSISEASARKAVLRGGARLDGNARQRVEPEEQRRLVLAFADAARGGNLHALERLLAADVCTHSDGGGVVHASRRPVAGRTEVARFHSRIAGRLWTNCRIEEVSINGRTGLLLTRDSQPFSLLTVDASYEGIEQVLLVLNPEKLKHLGPH